MQQYQENSLNRSRLPLKRTQVMPGPVVQASGAEMGTIADRVTALEALVAEQAATIAAQGDMIAAQALSIADHEARITALEP